jgi:ornithine cyclodeaminase/alanine dehydrogenase-like protein (mu-crystallin family)
VLYLCESDVRQLLPMDTAIELLHGAFERLARGESLNHPRRRLILKTGSVLHCMAAADGAYFGTKIYSTNPKHGAHFLFLLYRAADAEPLALMEANYLGQIRTGAASGLATRLMAPRGATDVAVIGSGFQARSQLEAIAAATPVRSARVWSRSQQRREEFSAECSGTLGFRVEAAASAEQAVRGAGIVVTATNAREPVLESAWIGPGTHINAVGSNQANRRELPADLVLRADTVIVDSREQARMEAGDLLLAYGEKDWERVKELQEVASGRVEARTRPEAITIFKSIGLALEDVVSAGYVYERAREDGIGRSVYS